MDTSTTAFFIMFWPRMPPMQRGDFDALGAWCSAGRQWTCHSLDTFTYALLFGLGGLLVVLALALIAGLFFMRPR